METRRSPPDPWRRAKRPGLLRTAPRGAMASGAYAEVAAADLGQRGHAFVDFLVAGAREAQPQAAARALLVHRPLRSGVDRNAFCERRFVELHRVDAVRQLHPQEDAALRVLELDRIA